MLFSMQLFTSTNSIGIYPNAKYYWRKREKSNKSTTQNRTSIKNIEDRILIIKEIINLFNSQKKYKPLINQLYKKLVEIDFRLYINQIDKGNDEYKNILSSKINPLLKSIPQEVFKNIEFINRIKYNLLINEQIGFNKSYNL